MKRRGHLIAIWNAYRFEREGADITSILADFPLSNEPGPSKGRYIDFENAPTNAILESIGISPARFRSLVSMRGKKFDTIEVHERWDPDNDRLDHIHTPIDDFDRVGPGMINLFEDHPSWSEQSDMVYQKRELLIMSKGTLCIRLAQGISWAIDKYRMYVAFEKLPETVARTSSGRPLADLIDIPCLAPFNLIMGEMEWCDNTHIWQANVTTPNR